MFKKNIEPNQEYYRGTRHHCPVKPVKTTGLLKNRKAKIKPTLTCTRMMGLVKFGKGKQELDAIMKWACIHML